MIAIVWRKQKLDFTHGTMPILLTIGNIKSLRLKDISMRIDFLLEDKDMVILNY